MKKSQNNFKEIYDAFFPGYPDVLDVKQLSEILGGIGKKTVYNLLRDGKIQSYKIGNTYRIPKIFILDYLGIIKNFHNNM